MAAVEKGTTVYLWGTCIDTSPALAVITSISLSKSYANTGVVTSCSGNVLEKRFDDVTYEGTATLQFETGFVAESMGANLSFTIDFDGTAQTVYITGINESHSNSGFREITYNVKSSEYVSLA